MTHASTLDDEAAQAVAQAVQAAYSHAVAVKWTAEARESLRQVTAEAVGTYLGQAPEDPQAQRYHMLLLDMSADATAETIGDWTGREQRAARLSATRALMNPTKAHHRPRAQALLKRLDLVQSPLLQVRERLLLVVARQRSLMAIDKMTGPLTRPADVATETGLMLLRRITDAVRAMPLPGPDDPASETAIVRLRELHGLVDSSHFLEPIRLPALFEAIQRLAGAERKLLALGPAIDALEAVRTLANPAMRAGRQALVAIVFELDLARYAALEVPALLERLQEVVRIAHDLADIPAPSLGAVLFRLRQRLADPANPDVDGHIAEALALMGRLAVARQLALSRLADAEALTFAASAEVTAARSRLREIDQIADAVHLVRLAGITPSQAQGLTRVYAQLDLLAAGHGLDASGFTQVLNDAANQLERPALTTNRLWLAGRSTLRQLVALRRSLEEQARGLALDARLDESARQSRHADLARRASALDQARVVLGSLQLERVHPAAQADALDALGAFLQAARLTVAAGESRPLRTALDLLVTIGSRLT